MNRRTIVISLVVVGLIASVMASEAAEAKAKHRSVTGSYSSPAAGAVGVGGGNCAIGLGCVEFTTKASEKTITVTVTDMSGQPVYASVSQDKATGDGVHQTAHIADICGKSKKLSIEGGFPVDVFLWEGPGATTPPCAGVATQGSVSAVIG